MTPNIGKSAWSSNHILFFHSRSARICCSNDSSPPLVSVPRWYHMQMYFNLFLGYEECKETMDGSILFWKKPKTKGCIWWPSWPCENQDQCLDSRSLYPNKFSPSCFLWLIWLIPIFATGKSFFFRQVSSASFHARASLRVSWPKFVLSELFISKFGHSPQASRRSGSIF